MRPIIKSFVVGDEIEPFVPAEKDNFSVQVCAEIGHDNSEGQELFYFTVVTPKFLENQLVSDQIIFGRHLIIVSEFVEEVIKNRIQKLLDSYSDSKNWNEISSKIAGYGSWEFEDYKPYQAK